MPIAWTSRLSYLEIQEDLKGLQLEVFRAIRDWSNPGPSIEDLATILNRKESSICARIDELRTKGAIEDAPIKISTTTGKSQKTYRVLVYRACAPLNQSAPSGQLSFDL